MRSSAIRGASLAAVLLCAACGSATDGPSVRVTIPPGSGLSASADSLVARKVIGSADAFKLYARIRGVDRRIKPGVYDVPPGASWRAVLDQLVAGEVVTQLLAVPEGWTVAQIAQRVAGLVGVSHDSVVRLATAPGAAERFKVPGPTLEGYLYPATYTFPVGASAEQMLRAMTTRYRQAWTPEMRQRADSLGLEEREVVALASIIEKEARVWQERPTISAVYHNRLRIRMRLQADPTVQYALGAHQSRLLYAHIDSVADNPYNTYRHDGLPPGPIASPSRGAIEAALNPADVDYLYFVARPDGTHVFTRSLAEHNAARRTVRPAPSAAPGR
jgi:UPF0755 protein